MEKKSLFTSNFSVVKKVLAKAFLFSIPIFLIFLFPLLIMFFSGELIGVYEAVKEDREVTFGLSYSYPVKFYKTQKTNLLKPEILVLGSSRSMQYSSSFFDSKKSFYCAGGAINALENFNQFWKNIENKPEYLIVTIDPWWFNEKFDNLNKNYFDVDFERPGNPARVFVNQWNTVYQDLFSGKISLSKIIENKQDYGLTAIMKNEGFIQDGTYQYNTSKLKKGFEADKDAYVNDALNNRDRFQVCNEVNPKAVKKFIKFIKKASKELGKENVFVMYPSLPSTLLQQLEKETHQNYFYLNDSLTTQLENINFDNYYYSNFNEDEQMLDGIHPDMTTIQLDLDKFAETNSNIKNILSK